MRERKEENPEKRTKRREIGDKRGVERDARVCDHCVSRTDKAQATQHTLISGTIGICKVPPSTKAPVQLGYSRACGRLMDPTPRWS